MLHKTIVIKRRGLEFPVYFFFSFVSSVYLSLFAPFAASISRWCIIYAYIKVKRSFWERGKLETKVIKVSDVQHNRHRTRFFFS